MRASYISKLGLMVLLTPFLAGCEEPRYVDSNGTEYYDANHSPTDYTPMVPYTKAGQYVNNPDDTTNTRDNRGNRPEGYGYDASDNPPATTVQATPGGRVYYSYPPGSTLNADGSVTYPDGTVVYPRSTTTTTTTVTH